VFQLATNHDSTELAEVWSLATLRVSTQTQTATDTESDRVEPDAAGAGAVVCRR